MMINFCQPKSSSTHICALWMWSNRVESQNKLGLYWAKLSSNWNWKFILLHSKFVEWHWTLLNWAWQQIREGWAALCHTGTFIAWAYSTLVVLDYMWLVSLRNIPPLSWMSILSKLQNVPQSADIWKLSGGRRHFRDFWKPEPVCQLKPCGQHSDMLGTQGVLRIFFTLILEQHSHTSHFYLT